MSARIVRAFGMVWMVAAAAATAAEVEPGLRERLDEQGRGSYLVLLGDRAGLEDLDRLGDAELRARSAYERLRGTAASSQAGLLALLTERRSADVVGFHSHFAVNALSVTSGVATFDLIAGRPEVARVLGSKSFPLPAAAPAPAAGGPRAVEWNVSRIGAPAVWALGHTGEGVVVATIDTGVRYTHAAVVGAYRGNLGGGSFDHDFNWYDPAGTCGAAPCDNVDYGTGLTSVLVGDDGGANQIGVAPGARWITAKGCAASSCSDTDLLAAADWLLAPCPVGDAPGAAGCDPEQRPDIVVVGWSGGGGDPWFQDAVAAWRAAGILPVVMAGNGGPAPGTVTTPGDYCDVVAVGSVDSTDAVSSWSARGPGSFACTDKPELAAPGSGVRVAGSTTDSAYVTKSGTSFAAAHAGGAAALLLAAVPSLGYDEVRALLVAGADDLAPAGFDYASGHGVVRVDQALALLPDLLLVDGFETGGTRSWSSRQPAPARLYLFDGGGSGAALGGRAGADAMCQAAVSSYPGVPTSHVRALLGVGAADEIRDMPARYGVPTDRTVVGPTGTTIAGDWSDLLDGSIATTLLAAGALPNASYWYSGSSAFGTLVPRNCTGWTTDGTLYDGRYGSRYATGAGWIATGDATCGLATYHVLCVAWD